MAKHFKPVGKHAVSVLARLAARNAIKQQLRDQGVRVTLVPVHEIEEKAREYLANHPELYVQAHERAVRMGWIDEQLSGVLVTPDWYGNRRPVTQKWALISQDNLVQLLRFSEARAY